MKAGQVVRITATEDELVALYRSEGVNEPRRRAEAAARYASRLGELYCDHEKGLVSVQFPGITYPFLFTEQSVKPIEATWELLDNGLYGWREVENHEKGITDFRRRN